MTELDIAFQNALTHLPHDYVKAKALLAEGANINATDDYGDSIINDCLFSCADRPPECDYCDEDSCVDCERRKNHDLLRMVEFFIENGWDTASYGLQAIGTLVHTTHDKQMFYAAKRILEQPISENDDAYEATLECIGTEESFQRCCEECHEQENLYYVMYELVEARMKDKDFKGFYPYHEALGKKVDKILYFADNIDFVETPRGTEYELDFGFVCGEDVVVIGPNVNIFLRNDLIDEQPQIDVSTCFGEEVVGARIVDISFEHKAVHTDQGHCGQPTIIVKFDSGKDIRFTHNFGELPDKATKARFVTAQAQNRINDRIDGLFSLCANTNIDLDKIESYIVGSNMTSEDVTKAALRLVDKYEYEVDSFKNDYGRMPEKEELVTSNWLSLFELFLKHGLDTESSFSTDSINYNNLLSALTFLDNRNIVYKLFRLLFDNGANPNVIIKDERLFDRIDDNAVINVTLFDIEGEDRYPYEHDFRLWLLMMAYGGEPSGHKSSLTIKEGYDIDMFANCEAFSYRKEITEDDWYLHIYITKTGEEVAVL